MGSVDKNENVEYNEETGYTGSKVTKRQKLKRHCAKWWWLHLIIFIVGFLAVLLGVLFGAVPKIAQDTIDKSWLSIESLSITNPGNTQFTFGQNATIHGDVPIKSHLDPQHLGLMLKKDDDSVGPVFMYLNISRLQLIDTIVLNTTDYPMEIVDKDAFDEFVKVSLESENFRIAMHAHTEIHIGALHHGVNYNEVVDLKGFNKLQGMKLTNPELLVTPESDGTNMLSDLTIENPSVFTLEVGNLTTNFAHPQLGPLGIGIIPNLTIRPGTNVVKVRAQISETFYKSGAAGVFVYSGTVTPLTVTGNSTVYNGQHVEWLEKSLNALPLTVPFYALTPPTSGNSTSST